MISVQATGATDQGTNQGARLLARITRHSAKVLHLQPGMQVFAQIKGMALLD